MRWTLRNDQAKCVFDIIQCRAANSWIKEPIGPYFPLIEWGSWVSLLLLLLCEWCEALDLRQRFAGKCSAPCCVSIWRRKSTLRWKARKHLWHWNGLKPVCFRLCVIRFDDWEKAFPQTIHLCGFSPKNKKIHSNFPSYFEIVDCSRINKKMNKRQRVKKQKWW